MRDFGEYLRAYWAYVSTSLGCAKVLLGAVVWLAAMFAPLAAKTLALLELPAWLMIAWMVTWSGLAYVLAPYGMWKHLRAHIASLEQPGAKIAISSQPGCLRRVQPVGGSDRQTPRRHFVREAGGISNQGDWP